jgi:hypothetical protein
VGDTGDKPIRNICLPTHNGLGFVSFSFFFQMLNMSEVKSRTRGIKTTSEVEFYWETSLNDPFGNRR